MRIRLILAFLSLAVLGACGGGSDGVRPVEFTSFSAVKPGQTVTASGISQTQSVTQDSSGVVTAKQVNSPDSNASSANLTYGAGLPLTLTGLDIATPQSNLSWKDGRGSQTVSCGAQTCTAAGEGAAGVTINALGSVAWNYQTFGYWLQNSSLGANVAGAISIGNPTPVGGIPVSGTATYIGLSGGFYVDSSGVLNEQAAVMSAGVDFGQRTISFATTGTMSRPWGSTAALVPAPLLNIAGPLNYAAGTNQFTGAVTTTTMTGTAVGRFYGPGAQEIGGTYSMTNPNPSNTDESMIGGFGGKKP